MGIGVSLTRPRPRRRPGLRGAWTAYGILSTLGPGVVSFGALFALWYLLTAEGWVHPLALAQPTAVARVLLESLHDRSLFGHIAVSLGRLSSSMLGAGLVGIVCGIAMGMNRRLATFFEPLASFFTALSGIVWLPLAITWFGLTWRTVLFVISNSIFFIVFFNTLVGIRSVPRIYEQAILTLGGSSRGVLVDVLIPGALPSIVTGLRMALGFGWRALIAAEMVAVTQGLGFMIFNATNYLRTDIILAGILVIGVVAIILDSVILVPLERLTILRWRMDQ